MTKNDITSERFNIFREKETYPDADLVFKISLKQVQEIKHDCYSVLDTNTLLIPYTISTESLEGIKSIYEDLLSKNRLRIPGQVAREFAKIRPEKLKELYQQLSKKLNVDRVGVGKYPLLEPIEKYQEILHMEGEINKKITDYKEGIKSLLATVQEWNWNDPVSRLYGELFTKEEVIFDLDFDEDEVKNEWERRKSQKIPPGYKDKGIGDFLIWKTIIEIGRKYKESVIFVSGDQKADWYHRTEKEALYPRFELVYEYAKTTNGKTFQIVNFSDFLKLYEAQPDVVKEVRLAELISTGGEEMVVGTVIEWLVDNYPAAQYDFGPLPYFLDVLLTDKQGKRTGIEVHYIKRSPYSIPNLIETSTAALEQMITDGRLDDYGVFIVADDSDTAIDAIDISGEETLRMSKLWIVIGYLKSSVQFQPIYDSRGKPPYSPG